MRSTIIFTVIFLMSLSNIIPLVSAFGEIAGPVVIHVAVGGSNSSNWGIFNNESINVVISAQGDGAQYISFPQSVTLLPNNQITWIPITASISSDYNGQTNITGSIYALTQGQPGQVQINLQLEKHFQILVQQNQANGVISNPSSTVSQSSSASSSISTISSIVSNSIPALSIPQQVQNIAPAVQQQITY